MSGARLGQSLKMPSTAPLPPYMQLATRPIPQAKSSVLRAAARYVIWLALIEILALSGAFWVATQPWFMDHEAPPNLRMMGYALRAAGKNCDVVLYGDSTALVGMDPSVIQSETGLTACNIAEIRTVLEVVGVHLPLDQYLAHNRPPKFLITAWGPGNFDFEHRPMESYFPDGYLYEFQYNRGPWLWGALIRHPKGTISFLLWVQGSILQNLLNKLVLGSPQQVDYRSLRDSRDGAFLFPQPPQRACEQFPSMPWISPARLRTSADKFKEQYATRTGHLLVDITPIADCFVEGRYRIASVQGLYDNTAQLWPVDKFASMNIHLAPQGARSFSEQVARQIEAIQQQERETQGERTVATR